MNRPVEYQAIVSSRKRGNDRLDAVEEMIPSKRRKHFSSSSDPRHQQEPAAQPTADSPSSNAEARNTETRNASEPHEHDVLCGRGGLINKHPGNVAFRRVVEHNKTTYHSCKKAYKILLSRSIVEAVARQNPPGRFLAVDKKTGLWVDIGKAKAIQKTSQALREGADQVRKNIKGQEDSSNSAGTNKRSAAAKKRPKPSSSSTKVSYSVEVEPEVNSSNQPRQPAAEDKSAATKGSDDCLGDMDDLDIFSDDTLFEQLEGAGGIDEYLMQSCDSLDPTEPIPLNSNQRILDVYAGVPVLSVSEGSSCGRDLSSPSTLDKSTDDNVSVVSIEPLFEDLESSSSDEDDVLGGIGLAISRRSKIWEL